MKKFLLLCIIFIGIAPQAGFACSVSLDFKPSKQPEGFHLIRHSSSLSEGPAWWYVPYSIERGNSCGPFVHYIHGAVPLVAFLVLAGVVWWLGWHRSRKFWGILGLIIFLIILFFAGRIGYREVRERIQYEEFVRRFCDDQVERSTFPSDEVKNQAYKRCVEHYPRPS